MRIHKKIFIFLLLPMVGLFIGILISEIFLRIFLPQDLSGAWLTKSEQGYALNAERHHVRHQFREREVFYNINTLHLRGPMPSEESQNVLLLGDSFTFGWLLPEENTLRAELQALALNNQKSLHFLNGGTGGWGTAQQLAYLLEYGDRLSLKAVVVLFNVNDVERSMKFDQEKSKSMRWKQKRWSLRDSRLYQFMLEHSHLLQYLRRQYITLIRQERQQQPWITSSVGTMRENSVAAKIIENDFMKMHEWCRNRDIQLLVTTTGWFTQERIKNTLSGQFIVEAPVFFQEQLIPFYDPSVEFQSAIQTSPSSFYISEDGHPNEQANKLLAKLLWTYINRSLN